MENYADAALRHWNDAQILEEKNSLGNADHLFGFAAECAIKTVLVKLPAFSNNGVLDTAYKEHVNTLWGKVNHQSLHKTYPTLVAFLKSTNNFSDWNVNQRYSANGEITKSVVELHKNSAKRLIGCAKLTGTRQKWQ